MRILPTPAPRLAAVRWIIFVIDDASGTASGDEMAAIDAFNDRLRDHGHWVLAAGIDAPDTATVIDDRGGAGETSPGSLTDDRDHYSGFWIIDVPDKERALALAAAGSRACNRRVELRPFLGE